MTTMTAPAYDVDLFSDEVIGNPYLHYKNMRDMCAVVWLPQHELWALPRFKEVRKALQTPEVFSSAKGFAVNDLFNAAIAPCSISSDPPLHAKLRAVLSGPMQPANIAYLRAEIEESAERLIEGLMAKKSFDGVKDLAHHLPFEIVSKLVGLPEEGRVRMLEYAAAGFDACGPLNDRANAAFPKVQELIAFTMDATSESKVRPGSWTAGIYEAAKDGRIEQERIGPMILEYVFPSLDTTINATSAALASFAKNPDQWDLLRSEPDLIPNTIDEVVRLDSPIRHFSRVLATDYEIDGIQMQQGQRVVCLIASANRDERQWVDPDRFDIRRKTALHVGFGAGVHTCGGMHLAKMEIAAVLKSLIKRVSKFEIVGEPMYVMNNVLRGFEYLPMRICS